MEKIKSFEGLKIMRESLLIESTEKVKNSSAVIKIAMATCGIASGAREIMNFFIEDLEKRGINAVVIKTGCMGYCYAEPTVEVTLPGKEPVVFGFVTREKADEIIEKFIKNKEMIEGVIPVSFEKVDL